MASSDPDKAPLDTSGDPQPAPGPPAAAASNDDGELPSYSLRTPPSQRDRTEHVYHLRSGSSAQPWLTLSFPSSASATDKPPYLNGGEPLIGTVKLDLAKPEWISGIDFTVRRHCLQGCKANHCPWP
jgi:hypothetical protein